jgi:hypothetical protein
MLCVMDHPDQRARLLLRVEWAVSGRAAARSPFRRIGPPVRTYCIHDGIVRVSKKSAPLACAATIQEREAWPRGWKRSSIRS